MRNVWLYSLKFHTKFHCNSLEGGLKNVYLPYIYQGLLLPTWRFGVHMRFSKYVRLDPPTFSCKVSDKIRQQSLVQDRTLGWGHLPLMCLCRLTIYAVTNITHGTCQIISNHLFQRSIDKFTKCNFFIWINFLICLDFIYREIRENRLILPNT